MDQTALVEAIVSVANSETSGYYHLNPVRVVDNGIDELDSLPRPPDLELHGHRLQRHWANEFDGEPGQEPFALAGVVISEEATDQGGDRPAVHRAGIPRPGTDRVGDIPAGLASEQPGRLWFHMVRRYPAAVRARSVRTRAR